MMLINPWWTMPTMRKKRAVAQQRQLARKISSFQRESGALLEALRLFGISNAEYERAMRALSGFPTVTTASTQPGFPKGNDALVE